MDQIFYNIMSIVDFERLLKPYRLITVFCIPSPPALYLEEELDKYYVL